jgi:hypothetical protein
MAATQATAEVIINDAQAQNALKGLADQADKLNKRLHEMKKANDLAGHDKAKKELDQVNKEMKAYTKTNQDLGRVLDNLSGASYNELVKVQRRLRSEMKGMKRDTDEQRKAFDAKAKQIKQVDGELSKMQKSMRGSNQVSSMFTDTLRSMGLPVDKFNKLISAQSMLMGKLAGATNTASQSTGVFSKALRILRIALISTGIGAIVVAVGALAAALFSTQRGTDALNKVLTPLRTVFERLWGIVQELGFGMVDAFRNPKQAIADLWEFLKSQIVNRIQGVMDMFTALGKVISSSLKLNFSEAGEAAKDFGNAYLQTMTGVEDVVEKAGKAFKGMGEEISQAFDEGKRLAEIKIQLQELAIEMAASESRLNRAFQEQYQILSDVNKTDQERLAAGQAAIRMNAQIRDMKMRELELLIQEAEIKMKQNDTDREAQLEYAKLLARRDDLQRDHLAQTRKIDAQINAMLKAETAAREKELEAQRKLAVDYYTELERLMDEQYLNTLSKDQRELEAIDRKYQALYEKAEAANMSTTELQEMHAAELAAKQKELEDQTQQEILQIKQRYGLDVSQELMDAELAVLQMHYDNKLLSEEQFQQAKANIEAKYNKETETEEKKSIDRVKKWEDADAAEKIARIQSLLNTAQGLFKENTIAHKLFATASATMDTYQAATLALSSYPPPFSYIAMAATIGAGLQQVAKINAVQFASGKYDVIGADDGRTYSAGYTPAASTGIYNEPTLIGGLGLVGERAPEMVIDGETLRNIQINYPAVIDAIHMARVPQFAAGNYPDMPDPEPESSPRGTYVSDGLLAELRSQGLILRSMDGKLSHPTRAVVSYNDIKDADDEMDDIKNNVSK